MKKPGFRMTVERLKILCRYKKQSKDKAMPTKRDLLIARYEATKGRQSPHVSPANSDNEGESGDEEGGLFDSVSEDEEDASDEESSGNEVMEEEGLVFDSDNEESSDSGSASEDSDDDTM